MINHKKILHQSTIKTTLGSMTAIADQSHIYLLKFSDTPNLETIIKKLCKTHHAILEQGITPATESLHLELQQYFEGKLKIFTTPLWTTGTTLQGLVWEQLNTIRYGEQHSYTQQAADIKKPSAVRAVARANASNLVAIVIPCHRVIGKNGKITGYNGGIYRKEWLLNHEQKHK